MIWKARTSAKTCSSRRGVCRGIPGDWLFGFRWKSKSAVIRAPRRYCHSPPYDHIRTCCIVPDTTFSCPCRHCRSLLLRYFLSHFPPHLPTSLLLPIRRLGSAIYKRIPAAETPVSQSFYSFGVCPRLNTTEINALLCRRRAPKDERPHKMATVGRRYAV